MTQKIYDVIFAVVFVLAVALLSFTWSYYGASEQAKEKDNIRTTEKVPNLRP